MKDFKTPKEQFQSKRMRATFNNTELAQKAAKFLEAQFLNQINEYIYDLFALCFPQCIREHFIHFRQMGIKWSVLYTKIIFRKWILMVF